MSLTKVKDFSNLRKDTRNGGVVNIDKNSYSSYKEAKMRSIEKQQEFKKSQNTVNELHNEINTLKEDMTQMKSLLLELIKKGE